MEIKPGEQVHLQLWGVTTDGKAQSKVSIEIYGLENALANAISNDLADAVKGVTKSLQDRKAGVEVKTR